MINLSAGPRETVPWNLSAWSNNCTRFSNLILHIWQSIYSPPCNLLTCFLRKCLLNEPDVAYSATLSRNARAGLPRQTKHLVSLFSLLIDRTAWLSASGSSTLTTREPLSFAGHLRWTRRGAGRSSTPQYAVIALIAIILRRLSSAKDVSGSVKTAFIRKRYSSVK